MFTIEGVVKNIVNEISANGSSTGRYLVDLMRARFETSWLVAGVGCHYIKE